MRLLGGCDTRNDRADGRIAVTRGLCTQYLKASAEKKRAILRDSRREGESTSRSRASRMTVASRYTAATVTMRRSVRTPALRNLHHPSAPSAVSSSTRVKVKPPLLLLLPPPLLLSLSLSFSLPRACPPSIDSPFRFCVLPRREIREIAIRDQKKRGTPDDKTLVGPHCTPLMKSES